MNKEKAIQYLFISAAVLLILNVFAELLGPSEDVENPKEQSLNTGSIEKNFVKTLYSFGLKEDWIKRSKKGTSAQYKIKLPSDIPIPTILSELNRNLLYKGIKIKSQEVKINGNARIEIIEMNRTVLKAEFVYDAGIIRRSPEFGILLLDIEDLSGDMLLQALNFPVHFSAVIVPNDENKNLTIELNKYGKEYISLLNNDVQVNNFQLDPDYSKVRLKAAVVQIASNFSDSKLFMFDGQSDLAKSSTFAFVKGEFKKRGIELIRSGKHKTLKSNTTEELASLLRFYVDSGQHEGEVFAFDAEDFLSIKDEFLALKKKGAKFVLPSQLNYGLTD